ncbi:MAG TPA: shikimate kinase [Usitatibacter sp.]|nr:shikimate kinase [Usitatibacter sp.]
MLDGSYGNHAMGRGNIFLVGMMGAGKTTIGKALARHLGREFVDCDRVLAERTGVPVATIFEIEGEEGFRRREAAVIAELAEGADRVVATGGGSILAEENRRAMRESGTVVYLRARLESLWERTRHDTSRPLLATPDPRAKLQSLLAEREPLYREMAHVTVDTGSPSTQTVVKRILAALAAHASSAP